MVYGLIFCKIQGRIYCKILIFKRDCVCFVTRAEIQRCQWKNYDPSRPSSRCSSRGFVEKKEKKKQQLRRACNSLTFQLNLLILGKPVLRLADFEKTYSSVCFFFIADVVAIDLRRKKMCELNNFCSLKSIIRIISTSSKFKTVKLNAASESGLHCMFKIKRRTFAHHKRYL